MSVGEEAGKGMGAFLKAGGAPALISVTSVLLVLVLGAVIIFIPNVRADAFTGTQATEMEHRLEDKIEALAEAVQAHVSSGGHNGTAADLAVVKADVRNLKEYAIENRETLRALMQTLQDIRDR